MVIKDIVVYPNSSFVRASDDLRRSFPPIKDRIRIFDDVYAEKLNRDTWEKTYRSCTLIGHKDATPQFTQLYAFVRELQGEIENKQSMIWDHDERLQLCLGLSRIVYPTNISFEFAARFIYEGEKLRNVIPGPVKEFGAKAWISRDDVRDWLSIDEAKELASVVEAFYRSESMLPKRVKRALWYLEYAFRTEFLDVRWPLICTGLESLIHTDRQRSTMQFSRRVSLLADRMGICDFTYERVKEAYNTRCTLVHGKLFRDMDPYQLDLYEKTENTLRLAIKKAILEPDFASTFSSEERIKAVYPVS